MFQCTRRKAKQHPVFSIQPMSEHEKTHQQRRFLPCFNAVARASCTKNTASMRPRSESTRGHTEVGRYTDLRPSPLQCSPEAIP